MAPEKTPTQLPIRSTIYMVTGSSGSYEDKSSWSVAAYSEAKFADKASNFLQKLANKLENHNEAFSDEFRRDLEELKLHDPKAYYNERIFYTVEPVIYVC